MFAGDRFADAVSVRYWPDCAGAICGESRGSDDMELRADHRCTHKWRVGWLGLDNSSVHPKLVAGPPKRSG